jgi:putative oxidoreductase
MTTVRQPTSGTRGRVVVLWAATLVLTIFFMLMGIPKVLGQTGWVTRFRAWGYPDWFLPLVGAGEIAGSIMLMIPRLATLGAMVIATIMVGAAATHIWHRELPRVTPPIVVLVLVTVVGRLRRRRTR